MTGLAIFTGSLGLLFGLFAILILILWILVPFAIFGIKPLLRQLIAEQQRTNQLLFQVATGKPIPATQPDEGPTLRGLLNELRN